MVSFQPLYSTLRSALLATSALLGGCASLQADSVTLTGAAAPETRRVVVTLDFDVPYPGDDSPQVVVEALEPVSEGELVTLELLVFNPATRSSLWHEVARVDAGPDGTYDVPLPQGEGTILLRADGDYVGYGEQQIALDGANAPSHRRLDLAVTVGAHVTLELEFERAVSEEELAKFEGRLLRFDSSGPSKSRSNFSGPPYNLVAELDDRGRAEIGALIAYDWYAVFDAHETTGEDGPPLCSQRGFSFEPKVGERVLVKVPIQPCEAGSSVVTGTPPP